jgi:hypothetical protein
MPDLMNKLGALFPSPFRASGLIAALMFLIYLTVVQGASAATYTVTTTADAGTGSLRAAIASANASTIVSDTINFTIPANDTGCTAGVCTITLTSGALIVDSSAEEGSLTIANSTGASNLLISGNNASRVFFVISDANLTISGVTITKGNGTSTTFSGFNGDGGGIFNNGSLTLINSSVNGNTASSQGGGIRINGGTLILTNSTVNGNTTIGLGGGIFGCCPITVTNSTISDNTAGTAGGIYSVGALTLTNSIVNGNRANNSAGGGIYLESISTVTNSTVSNNTAAEAGGGVYNATSSLTLTNSTVSGNTASAGGGIFNSVVGGLTLTNSTVSSNTGANSGGGIFNSGVLQLTSVTVTNNRSTNTGCTDCAGGIFDNGATSILNSTIVAGNTAANASASPDFRGAVSSIQNSYNIIGNNQGTTGITNGTSGNQVGTPASPIDPRLAPLADNGGATQTHALMFNSPAIDKGSSFGLTTDQRGFDRPVNLDDTTYPNATNGDGSDIGAFEAQSAPAAPTAATVAISGYVTSTFGRGILGIQLSLTDSQGNTRTATTATGGYYRFEDVQVGETYILSASGKRYTFSQSVQVLNVNEETGEVNFIANAEKRFRSF